MFFSFFLVDRDLVAHLAAEASLVVHAANRRLTKSRQEAVVAVKSRAEVAQRVQLNESQLVPDRVNVIRTSLAVVIAVHRRDQTEIAAVIDLVRVAEHPMFQLRESQDHGELDTSKNALSLTIN